jgi:hypothetical protein
VKNIRGHVEESIKTVSVISKFIVHKMHDAAIACSLQKPKSVVASLLDGVYDVSMGHATAFFFFEKSHFSDNW